MFRKSFLLFIVIQFILFNLKSVISPLSAQNKTIDSLLSLLKKGNEDTVKINRLNELCEKYQDIDSYDTSLTYGYQALRLSQQLKFENGMSQAYTNLGNTYMDKCNYDKALENHLAAWKINEEMGNKTGISASYNNLGNVYYSQRNFDRALENYLASLKIDVETNNKEDIAASYINIGNVYLKRGDYDKALENYFPALKIGKEMGNKQFLSMSYINIGNVYEAQGEYDRALENYLAAQKITEAGGNKLYIAAISNNIGIIYKKKKNYREAIVYLKNGVNLSAVINVKDLTMEGYQELSDVYEKMKDWENAYQYHRLYSQIKDSIFNSESNQKMIEMQTKYETEKKEKEIELLAKQRKLHESEILWQKLKLKQNRIITFVLIIGLVTTVLIFVLIHIISRIRQKEMFNRELLKKEKQNLRNIIEVQENERKRIAKDLHDGVGQILAALKIAIAPLSDKDISGNGKEVALNNPDKLIDHACTELRNISHQMLPRVLSEMGLTDAMKDLLYISLSGSNIRYSMEIHNINRMEEQREIGMYRVFQELLSNVIRHSGATELSVHLYQHDGKLILIVEDNGCGPGTVANRKKGMGLVNISTRVEAMNGVFSIHPGPEKGVIANIRIPIS